MKPTKCPECGGRVIGGSGYYFCKDCDRPFSDDDIAKELEQSYEDYKKSKEAK